MIKVCELTCGKMMSNSQSTKEKPYITSEVWRSTAVVPFGFHNLAWPSALVLLIVSRRTKAQKKKKGRCWCNLLGLTNGQTHSGGSCSTLLTYLITDCNWLKWFPGPTLIKFEVASYQEKVAGRNPLTAFK